MENSNYYPWGYDYIGDSGTGMIKPPALPGDGVTSSEMDNAIKDAIGKLVDNAPEELDTFKEIADLLSGISENEDQFAIIQAINGKLDKSEYESDKENFALKSEMPSLDDYATKGEIEDEYQKKGNYVEYQDYQGRNTIQLKNYDSVSGVKTTGEGVNIAMVSKWDVADFGSTQLPINLNGSEERPTYNDNKAIALLEDIPSMEGFATAEEQAQLKGDIDELKDNAVTYTEFDGGRKTIVLRNRDTISANTPNGGSQVAMVSDYEGLDFPVVEIGGQNGALVLNTREDRVKVEVVENGKRVQHSIATLDDGFVTGETVEQKIDTAIEELVESGTFQEKGDYPVYERYDNEVQGIHKKTIVLENDDNISGKRTDGLGVNLVEVSKWNVADFGSKSVHINLNGMYERPTYNDKHGVALLDDIEKFKAEFTEYFNGILRNYNLKSSDDIVNEMKKGGDFILAGDLKSTAYVPLSKSADIDLNGYTLGAYGNANGYNVWLGGNGVDITIKNGEVTMAENASSLQTATPTILVKSKAGSKVTLEDLKVTGTYPIYLLSDSEDNAVTINSGEYYSTHEDNDSPTVYVQTGGKVTINGGTFGQKGVKNDWVLNIYDSTRKGRDAREFIEVTGGQFWNFNPADNATEGKPTSYVAEGYHVESEQVGDDVLYTVVKD